MQLSLQSDNKGDKDVLDHLKKKIFHVMKIVVSTLRIFFI
jgi:hypothetical protein